MSAIYRDGHWYGSDSSGHMIKDAGTDLYPREGLNFTDFDVSDDPTNDETDVKPHRLSSEEINGIVVPPDILPSYSGNPTGTIISFMGKTAPQGYLFCDGTVYSISVYESLAGFFEQQFGTKNHFGGDGTTTFAVPDLRGEFLRGTGTNSHANQGSGADVGVHQDATIIENINVDSGSNILYVPTPIPYSSKNIDSDPSTWNNVSKAGRLKVSSTSYDTYTAGSGGSLMTSRPTNTSILYCIKY